MSESIFRPGRNMAMKVPADEFEATVAFYRDVLGLRVIDPDSGGSVIFEFGDKRLWIDRMEHFSQAEIWLEVEAEDVERAAAVLRERGVVRRDEIEALPDGFKGFWIKSPCGVIHLVAGE